MSTKFATCLLFGLALALPAIASAGFPGFLINDFEGTVEQDPTARIGFDVDRETGRRAAHNFDLGGIPFSCRDGSIRRQDGVFEASSIRVRDGRFEGRTEDPMVGYILDIKGKLRPGGQASGVLRMTTDSPLPEGDCYSGILRWTASK